MDQEPHHRNKMLMTYPLPEAFKPSARHETLHLWSVDKLRPLSFHCGMGIIHDVSAICCVVSICLSFVFGWSYYQLWKHNGASALILAGFSKTSLLVCCEYSYARWILSSTKGNNCTFGGNSEWGKGSFGLVTQCQIWYGKSNIWKHKRTVLSKSDSSWSVSIWDPSRKLPFSAGRKEPTLWRSSGNEKQDKLA